MLSEQNKSDVAPLSLDLFDDKEKFLDIDIGVFDYVFKCIDGPYQSKFIYLNTASSEIIGGGQDYDISKNYDNVTMFIEKADLSTRHAEITFTEHCQYVLKDLSQEEQVNPSSARKGIWIKIPMQGKGIDLYANNNLKRRFMIGKHKYQFVFEETSESVKEVELWIEYNGLQFAMDMIRGETIEKLDDLFSLDKEIFKKYGLTEQQQTQLVNFIKDMSMKKYTNKQSSRQLQQQQLYSVMDSLPSSQGKKQLKLISTQGLEGSHYISGEKDFTIKSNDKDECDQSIPEIRDLECKIYYHDNTFYLKGQEQEKLDPYATPSIFYQLLPGEEFILQPGIITQMGQVQFLVERYNCGVMAALGYRSNMEDTYVVNQDLDIDDYLKASLFVVIDGHGGEWCSDFLKMRIAEEIKKQLCDPINGVKSLNKGVNKSVNIALTKAFLNLDDQFYEEMQEISYKCGAAAVAVLILGNRVYCANVGDSRAVLCRNGKAIDLSVDHKATRHDEAERVKRNGGTISVGRVENRLAITRAFGDYEFKIE